MEWKRESTARYAEILKSGLGRDYIKMFREAEGTLKYPYLVPGSRQYAACLWDWDSWLTDMAIRQIMRNPVSYTHLDVYKRQDKAICGAERYCGEK